MLSIADIGQNFLQRIHAMHDSDTVAEVSSMVIAITGHTDEQPAQWVQRLLSIVQVFIYKITRIGIARQNTSEFLPGQDFHCFINNLTGGNHIKAFFIAGRCFVV